MSVIPYLTIADGRGTEAAEFYTKLFDAKEGLRMPTEDKRLMHCELHFGGNAIYLADNIMGAVGAPAMTTVFVGFEAAKDVDALAARAKQMGATITQEPQDMFWGDRFAMFTDPFGHRWSTGAPAKS